MLLVDGLPRNGATVKLWSSGAAFLTTPPEKNTALPLTGSPVATATTGTAHGADGAYRFTAVTAGVYYASIEWRDLILYDSWEIPSAGTPSGIASVKAYGAVGDGVTNDTTAIQAALADTAVNHLYFPPGTYLSGNLNITNRTGLTLSGDGATLQKTGTGSSSAPIGLRITGTCRELSLRSLRFLGDGTDANYHNGIWLSGSVTLEGLRIEGCHFEQCVLGVWINQTAGSLQAVTITSCWFENGVGTGSLQGTGIWVTRTASAPMKLAITDNHFSAWARHGIHIERGVGVTIRGNHLGDGGGNIGNFVPAILLGGCRLVTVESNQIDTCYDGGIGVVPNATTSCRLIQIRGNTIHFPVNDVSPITIGSTNPATNGSPDGVIVTGNQIYMTGIAADAIVVNSLLRGRIEGNVVEHLLVPSGTRTGLYLSGSGDSGSTRTYTDDLTAQGNLLYGTTSGGTFVGINLAAAFCTSTARVEFRGNRVRGGNMFNAGATITNDQNLFCIDQEDDGLSFDTGVELETLETGPLTMVGSLDTMNRSISSNYTLTQMDQAVLANANGGTITVTLPAANGCRGRRYTITRTDANGGFTVGIVPSGADTINGATARTLYYQDQSLTLESNGSSRWNVVSLSGYSDLQLVRTITTSTSADIADRYLRANAAGGSITLTLPSVADVPDGWVLTVTRVTSTSNNIVLDGAGAETIDGSATYTLPTGAGTIGNFVTIVNDGSAWLTVEVAD